MESPQRSEARGGGGRGGGRGGVWTELLTGPTATPLIPLRSHLLRRGGQKEEEKKKQQGEREGEKKAPGSCRDGGPPPSNNSPPTPRDFAARRSGLSGLGSRRRGKRGGAVDSRSGGFSCHKTSLPLLRGALCCSGPEL